MAVTHFVESHLQVRRLTNGWQVCPLCGFSFVPSLFRYHILSCADKHFIETGRAAMPAPGSTVSGG